MAQVRLAMAAFAAATAGETLVFFASGVLNVAIPEVDL